MDCIYNKLISFIKEHSWNFTPIVCSLISGIRVDMRCTANMLLLLWCHEGKELAMKHLNIRGRSWFIERDQHRYLSTLSKWFYLWVYAAPVRFFSDDNHSKQIYCTWSKRVILLFILHFAALNIISYHVVSPESITFSQRGDVQHQWTVSTISSSVPS